MKQIDKNALVDWEKYKEDVMRSTPVDQSMSHAERERHRIYLEAHPIEWMPKKELFMHTKFGGFSDKEVQIKR